ncbi:DUF7346 family protein [Natronocalculus amylovorans]|uniref:Uncharacterized protein n=1 Tax=Natronocalculus amylovorans TaxID=2917812 RepID=A0AAE3FUK8_9EURY|nr:hypothetical protein [Natronocalculus amylovorans]MCL9815415.1 hypothetical protein [Natronocalculus amylovorans]
MRTVRDADGTEYILRKSSSDAWLVYDPNAKTESYMPADELTIVSDTSPLTVAASTVSPPVRRILSATHNDQSLGLLIELVDRGPISVIDLLNSYDFCESDLHGLLSEFRAAGLVTEEAVLDTRGYAATDIASDGISMLRSTARGDEYHSD